MFRNVDVSVVLFVILIFVEVLPRVVVEVVVIVVSGLDIVSGVVGVGGWIDVLSFTTSSVNFGFKEVDV